MTTKQLHITPENINLRISLPASKSISNRALILNALAYSPYEIENLSDCDDTRVMVKALDSSDTTFDIGAAGTAMRFLTVFFIKNGWRMGDYRQRTYEATSHKIAGGCAQQAGSKDRIRGKGRISPTTYFRKRVDRRRNSFERRRQQSVYFGIDDDCALYAKRIENYS